MSHAPDQARPLDASKPVGDSPALALATGSLMLSAFLKDLLAVMDKHHAELFYTTDADGIHARVGRMGRESTGFFYRQDIRKQVESLANK